MSTSRLFLGLWPSTETQAALDAFQCLTTWPAGARPVPRLHFHITLHFIGDVARERLPEMREALAIPSPLVRLVLDRSEIWHHGIAVLTGSALPLELIDFHAQLGERLTSLDLAVDGRDFRPHVTVARNVGPEWKMEDAAIEWVSSGYSLVESAAGRYHVLQAYP